MPQPDPYQSQPPLELLRQFLDSRGFYDSKKLQWKEVHDVTLLAACAPPGGGRSTINDRLLRHFGYVITYDRLRYLRRGSCNFLPVPTRNTLPIAHRITPLLNIFWVTVIQSLLCYDCRFEPKHLAYQSGALTTGGWSWVRPLLLFPNIALGIPTAHNFTHD